MPRAPFGKSSPARFPAGKLSADKLLARLKGGKHIPAITLLGHDSYLRDLCRQSIIEAFVPASARDWAVQLRSAKEDNWSEIARGAQTIPMMSPMQVIVVSDLEAWERLGEEASKTLSEDMAAYFKDPAPFTVLVFESPKLDDRRRLSKIVAGHAELVKLETSPEETASIAARIASELSVKLDSDALASLADMFPGNPGRIRAEMEKVGLYAAGRSVTRADVEALVVAERKSTVWELADLLAARRGNTALEFLDSLLRAGEQPAGIVGALAWMFRKLIEARELPSTISGYDATRRLGMRGDGGDMAMRHSRRFSREALLSGLVALAEADNRLKSGISQPRAVMEFLISDLTAASAARQFP